MNFLLKLISDDTGAPSTTRIVTLLTTLTTLVIWTVLCIHARTFVEIPASALTAVGASLGAKVLQSFSENFSPAPPAAAAPTGATPQGGGVSLRLLCCLAFAVVILAACASSQARSLAWNPSRDQARGTNYAIFTAPPDSPTNFSNFIFLANAGLATNYDLGPTPEMGRMYLVIFRGTNGIDSDPSNIATNGYPAAADGTRVR